MKLLLDTCAFLWIVSGSDNLSIRAKEFFSDKDNDVFLSAVSAWEIAIKHSLGRLPLPGNPEMIIPEWRRLHGVESLRLDEASVLQLPKLPTVHNDPFDRMLICQAIVHGLIILTPDENILKYPIKTVW